MDLYFRGLYHASKQYRGVNGTLYNCGESPEETCKATMGGKPYKAPYKVFYTDFENIDVYYSCKKNDKGEKVESFSVSLRDPKPSPEILKKAKQVVKERIP